MMYIFPRAGASARHLTRIALTWSALTLTAAPMAAIGQTALPSGSSSAAQTVQQASGKTDALLSSLMKSHPNKGWSSVIIQLNEAPTPTQLSSLQALRADVYRRLPVIHALAARIPTRNLTQLADLPFIHHISTDNSVKKTDAFTISSSEADVAYNQYGVTGQGVTVAIIDSGVVSNADLNPLVGGLLNSSGLIQSVSVVGGKPDDQCGHGTHVAGIIAGNGAQSTGLTYTKSFYGIAPLAKIVSVRALDQNGQGTVSGVVAGIQWVITNQAKYGIRVLNLSLGHPIGDTYQNDPLCQAVESAWKAGIVVVCAAGNAGRINTTQTTGASNEGWGANYGSIESPGNDPYVITAGATKSVDGLRAHDQIATYSSRGPSRLDLVLKPDIIAPGNRIISLDNPNGTLEKNYGSTNDVLVSYYQSVSLNSGKASKAYFQLSGTSMATPVVVGAIADMLQANPKLTPDTIKARLMLSADKWTATNGIGDPCTYGAGYLNIPAALKSTYVATQPAISPSLSIDTFGNVYLDAARVLWGAGSIWGTGITDYRALWGTNALYGLNANMLDASRALWGTSVWNDRALWGTTTAAADTSPTVINGEK